MPARPATIADEESLDELLSRPTPPVVALMQRLEGDLMVLGVGGKMGATVAVSAVRAAQAAGVDKSVRGVSRFSDPRTREHLEQQGVETLQCDLLDRRAAAELPSVENIIYMVGRKFGTQGEEDLTWATNVIVPNHVCQQFPDSRIVVFSTGCVYPLVSASTGGCTEQVPPDPVGEYAQSCLGRERVFQYCSRRRGLEACLLRLNYAVDLRYGVLHDIGRKVFQSEPVDLTVSHVNVIWQGDASRQALLSLELCASPPAILNVTGPETVSVRFLAETFAGLFGVEAEFVGGDAESHMYLSNAAKATALFGYPSVPLLTLIRWQADWIRRGERTLDKPTHYGVVDGQY